MSTLTRPLDADQAAAASESSRLVSEALQRFGDAVERYLLRTDGDGPEVAIRLPRTAVELLRDVLEEMGHGHAVRIMPVHAELTTQEAAELLNVSRPHVVKLIEAGKLPARRVGTHRRIRVEDVMDYKRQDGERRQQILDELSAETEELGLGYD